VPVYKIKWKRNRHDRGETTINGDWKEACQMVEEKLEEGYKVWVNGKRRKLENGFICPPF